MHKVCGKRDRKCFKEKCKAKEVLVALQHFTLC